MRELIAVGSRIDGRWKIKLRRLPMDAIAACQDCGEIYYAEWPLNDIIVKDFQNPAAQAHPIWQCFICFELERQGYPTLKRREI